MKTSIQPPVTVRMTHQDVRNLAEHARRAGMSPEAFLVKHLGDTFNWQKGARFTVTCHGSPEAWRVQGW